ncbi:MAG: hypothetical protein Tsb009_39130 [Planctomycetaceae bacterium]
MANLICAKTFLNDYDLDRLVPLEEFQGVAGTGFNPLYPVGSIQLEIRGKRFLDREEILDSVECTWNSLATWVVNELITNETSEWWTDPDYGDILFVSTLMPSGFVEIKRVEDESVPQRVVVQKQEFIRGILGEAFSFYEELIRILPPRYRGEYPQSDARDEQKRIAEILKKLDFDSSE